MLDVDSLARGHAEFPGVRFDNRTDLGTVTAAGTAAADDAFGSSFGRGQDTAGVTANGDVKVTDVTFNGFDFSEGVQFDAGHAAGFGHLRRQNALGTVKRRERFVQLGHTTADGRFFLDEVGFNAGFGEVHGGLDTGYTGTDDHGAVLDGNGHRVQVFQKGGFGDGDTDGVFGFGSAAFPVVHVDPGALVTDVGHLETERVQAAVGGGGTECGFVKTGSTGSDDDTGKVFFFDGVVDHVLTGGRTHVRVVFGDDYVR